MLITFVLITFDATVFYMIEFTEKYFFKVVRTRDGRTNIVEQILYNKGRWIKH